MRHSTATALGFVFTGIVALAAAGLGGGDAGATPALLGPKLLGATDGGIAPSIALATQGLVKPPAIEDVEEMCALLIGCNDVPLPIPSQDLGECVRTLWRELAVPEAVKFSISLRECGLGSNSCKALRECALHGVTGDVCAGRGMDKQMSYCDGDGRALTCNKGKLVQVRNCPRFGEQCAAKNGQSTCFLGSCPPDVPADGTPVCSGNGAKIFVCDGGKLLSFDCGGFGLTCTKGPDGKPTCASEKTPACEKDAKRCDGDDHVGCVGGHEVRVQCGKSGMKCAEVATKDSVGTCTAPTAGDGAACSGQPSRCVGNNVQYCAGGKTRSFFCKGLGFAKCVGGPGQARCSL